MLRRYRDRCHSPLSGEPVGYLFAGGWGEPLRPDSVTHLFRQLNDESGLPPIRLHDLRHGAASLSLAAGNDLKTVQDLLGHASIVLTADTYASVLPCLARQSAEATAQFVLDAARTTGTRLRTRRRHRAGARQPVIAGRHVPHCLTTFVVHRLRTGNERRIRPVLQNRESDAGRAQAPGEPIWRPQDQPGGPE